MPPRGPTPPWGDEQRGGGETMTEVETKVFDNESLGRRLMRKKLLGKIPALPLVTLLVVASFAAAAIYVLGPSSSQSVTLGSMSSGGLPVGDILFGQVGTNFYFNITITANTYTQAHTANVVLTASNAALTNQAACGSNLAVMDAATPPVAYSAIAATFTGTNTCVYTGTFAYSIPAGNTAQTWPFAVKYIGSPSGAFVWTSQFEGN